MPHFAALLLSNALQYLGFCFGSMIGKAQIGDSVAHFGQHFLKPFANSIGLQVRLYLLPFECFCRHREALYHIFIF